MVRVLSLGVLHIELETELHILQQIDNCQICIIWAMSVRS